MKRVVNLLDDEQMAHYRTLMGLVVAGKLSRKDPEFITYSRLYESYRPRSIANKLFGEYRNYLLSITKEERKAKAKLICKQKTKNHQKMFPEKWRGYARKRYTKHRGRLIKEVVDRERKRMKEDVGFRITKALRCRMFIAIRDGAKKGSAVRDLGCTIDELKDYLEKKFKNGMSWANWKHDGWHIDHIIPLSRFDLTNRDDYLKACHYTNLQPLWAKENLAKGAK